MGRGGVPESFVHELQVVSVDPLDDPPFEELGYGLGENGWRKLGLPLQGFR